MTEVNIEAPFDDKSLNKANVRFINLSTNFYSFNIKKSIYGHFSVHQCLQGRVDDRLSRAREFEENLKAGNKDSCTIIEIDDDTGMYRAILQIEKKAHDTLSVEYMVYRIAIRKIFV